MTRAPRAVASWTAMVPTPPAAPCMSTVSPAVTASKSRTRSDVAPAIGSATASSQSSPEGLRATVVDSAYSAYEPVSAQRVDPGRLDADTHLAGAGLRDLDVGLVQHFRAAETVEDDRLHECSLR